jgi:predicted O-methyltransferase YrrM
MHGSNLQRTGRLLAYLLPRPRMAWRWIRTGPLTAKTPLDLEVPWFSWAAIDHLERSVRAESAVFEFGSGGSTLFLAQRAAKVVSVEHDAEWAGVVAQRLRQRGLGHADLRLASLESTTGGAFDRSEYLCSLPEEPRFDLIVVDGWDNDGRLRPICFRRAERAIRPGGMIVLDDAWRYPEVVETSRAHQRLSFRGTGPCRPGVTQTDLYLY